MTYNRPLPDTAKEKYTIASLFVIVSVFTAIIFVMTVLRYMDFLSMNWDLGINMQMMWTNTHGFLLFETADHETSGALSFLQVNSAYIAIPISYIYRIFSSAYFLLLLQSIVLSFSAIPLYLYAKSKTQNSLLSLFVCVVFLGSFAVMSGVFYDFHWEAFIPLEFFTFIFLFNRRRIYLALIVIIIGAMTLEAFPFFCASYLLYFFIFPENAISTNINYHHPRRTGFLTIVFSGLIYFIVAFSGGSIIPHIIGYSTSTEGAGVHAITYLFGVGLNIGTIYNSAVYWLLLLMALAFIPLVSPKALLVVVPWIYFSVVVYPGYTSQFGNQYGILVMSLLIVPFVEGIRKLHLNSGGRPTSSSMIFLLGPLVLLITATIFETTDAFLNHHHLVVFTITFSIIAIFIWFVYTYMPLSRNIRSKWLKKVSLRSSMVTLMILIIIVGLLIGPLNPMNESPPVTGGYSISYSPSPSFSYIGGITDTVGHNSSVLTTDNLFPFVADNPNSYSFFWYLTSYQNNPYFPFNNRSLPKFILLDSSMMYTVPQSWQWQAFKSGNYGLKIEIQNNEYPGNIYLFQLHYTGLEITYMT